MTYLEKLKKDSDNRIEFEKFEQKQREILTRFTKMVNDYGETYLDALEKFNDKFEEDYNKPIKLSEL